MDRVVSSIQKTGGSIDNYIALATNLGGQRKILANNADKADAALAALDVKAHSLGWVFILDGKIKVECKDHNLLAEQIRALCLDGDQEQLLLVPKLFSNLCMKFAESLILTDNASQGVVPLKKAVLKIKGSDVNLLTPVHTAFALVCLKSLHYDYARCILDTPIFKIDPQSNGLISLDYLSYFYYTGMIYTGLKNYTKAIENFKLTLTVPTTSLSVVQLESYRSA